MKKTILVGLIFLSANSTIGAIAVKGYVPARQTVLALIAMQPDDRKAALYQQPESVYQGLISLAFDKKEKMTNRWKALTSAAQFKREDSIADLEKAILEPEWFMKNAALVSLDEVDPEKAQVVAKKLISDNALVVRSAAVDILTKKLTLQNRQLLFSELNQKYNFRNGQSLWIRNQIIKKLANNPLASEKAIFQKLANEKDQAVQFDARRALRSL